MDSPSGSPRFDLPSPPLLKEIPKVGEQRENLSDGQAQFLACEIQKIPERFSSLFPLKCHLPSSRLPSVPFHKGRPERRNSLLARVVDSMQNAPLRDRPGARDTFNSLNDRANLRLGAQRGLRRRGFGSVRRSSKRLSGPRPIESGSRDSVQASHAMPISSYRPSISSRSNVESFDLRRLWI